MHYNFSLKYWQLYVQNLSQHTVVDSFHPSDNLVPDLALHRRQFSHQNQHLQSLQSKQQLPLLSPIKCHPRLGFNLKRCLALIPWLLLPYTTTTQALSATTVEVINGSEPYLTFDNGVTKVTTTEGLLSITISDGTTQTTYTPGTNTSTSVNPIVLPVANQSFADIGMLVPTNTNSISLSTLISAPNNYWGDDDGDGQGANGITATGDLSVSITDNTNQAVSRSAILDICKAPYKVELTSTDGSLTTQYGIPNIRSFSGGTATYYINPKAEPKICYARPNLRYGTNGQEISGKNFAGPATIWNPDKGFLVQSTESSSYSRNFPSTGIAGVHFDLLVGGIDVAALTWPTVTQGGITVTMYNKPRRDSCSEKSCFNPDGASSVRVTLHGPSSGEIQQWSDTPGSVARPTLPQTFVLVGKDSSNREVLKYGFVLKQWFATRGQPDDYITNHSRWCTAIGYRLTHPADLTNAISDSWSVAAPSSAYHYQRNIGSGLLSEWGNPFGYGSSISFDNSDYLASDTNGSPPMYEVDPNTGGYGTDLDLYQDNTGICVYP